MKNYLILLIFPLCLFSACNSGSQELKGKIDTHVVLKPFSDSIKVDTFKVILKGKMLKEMNIDFTITTYNGKIIYNKIFKATDLIENYKATLDLKKEQSQLDFVLNEYKLFLDDENFLEPAVTENESPDQYTPDKSFYNELMQSSLNGFKYRTGNENNIYIAWSEKEQKVKPYYNCCK